MLAGAQYHMRESVVNSFPLLSEPAAGVGSGVGSGVGWWRGLPVVARPVRGRSGGAGGLVWAPCTEPDEPEWARCSLRLAGVAGDGQCGVAARSRLSMTAVEWPASRRAAGSRKTTAWLTAVMASATPVAISLNLPG